MADEDTSESKGSEKAFAATDLEEAQKKDYDFVIERIPQLQKNRMNHYGTDMDKLWVEADRDYVPHRLKSKGKKVIATDEEKGWRSSTVTLGSPDWQSDVSQANPYVKVQTALAILIDQNPSAVLTAANKKYQATTEIMKQLYSRSWEVAGSKAELKKFVFNLAKYGWAAGRTFPLRQTRKVKVLKTYNSEDPEKSVYEEKEVIEYDDVMRENLDVRNVWVDDMARPNSKRSVNDWVYRKVFDFDDFKEEFGKYKRVKDGLVLPGGNTQEVVSKNDKGSTKDKDEVSRKKIEVFYYENKSKDLYMVVAGSNKVPIIVDPLPVSDQKGTKKLTLWQTYWNLRHSESPYGIGIYESIRFDQGMLDRIRNMSLDQLTLSIYKMFFFQGTSSLTETGDIKITPGVGKQVLDPKNINWLDVPGPGKDAFMGMEMMRKDVDEASGITDPLLGAVTGKTAFEIAQAKESALKRLKNPLDNILEALNEEGSITICLMQLMYSVPEVYAISDERLVNDYMKEIGGDSQLFSREPGGEEGAPETFNAKVYREFPMNLDKDEVGNLIEAADTRFFRIKPGALDWDGVINIKSQSLLSPSKQVEKALEMEMYNILSPIMMQIAQERDMKMQMGMGFDIDNATQGKVAKNIIKLYDKDPRDVFPEEWLAPAPQPLFVGMGSPAAPNPLAALFGGGGAPQAPQAETVAPSAQMATNPKSITGKVSSAMSQPFRSV